MESIKRKGRRDPSWERIEYTERNEKGMDVEMTTPSADEILFERTVLRYRELDLYKEDE